MDSLLDILLSQMLNGKKKPEKQEKDAYPEGSDDPKEGDPTLEEQAELEVRKRAQRRMEELMKAEEVRIEEAISRQKRKLRNIKAQEQKQSVKESFLSSLVVPTKRLQWDLVDNDPDRLRAFLEGEHVFDIKRGIMTYKLSLVGNTSLFHRAERSKQSNVHSSVDVYRLKSKAEKMIDLIDKHESMTIKSKNE